MVILVVKVKNMMEAEMGNSDCGNSTCTARFLGGLAWGRGGLLKKASFALCLHVMQYVQDGRKGRKEWIGDDTCYTIYMENTDAH